MNPVEALRALLADEDPNVRASAAAAVARVEVDQIGGLTAETLHLIAACMSAIRTAREIVEARTVREAGRLGGELEGRAVEARALLVDRATLLFVRALAAELGLDGPEPAAIDADEWRSVLVEEHASDASKSPRDAARSALRAIGTHVPNGCRN